MNFGETTGRDVLGHILETDENARRLGECALICEDTPIHEKGILFYDTLYDEIASCRLALGAGFPDCFESGYDMSPESLIKADMNQSHTHVDFMIRSDDLKIDGITKQGDVAPIFVDGQWIWE